MVGKKRSKSASSAPISLHPAFPAIVALWFASLLGLGSLVLPVALVESIITSTGVSSVIAAAAPPLGFTARLLIAVFAALAGAGAGLLIARKVAAAQMVEQEQAVVEQDDGEVFDEPELRSRAPISAHEELGTECLDEPVASAENNPPHREGRRRGLTADTDNNANSWIDTAPLPGGEITLEGQAEPEVNAVTTGDDQPSRPLELAELVMDEAKPAEADITADEQVRGVVDPFPDESGSARRFDAPTRDPDWVSIAGPDDDADAALDDDWDTEFEAPIHPETAQFSRPPKHTSQHPEGDERSMEPGEALYNPLADHIEEGIDADDIVREIPDDSAAKCSAGDGADFVRNAPIAERPLTELGVAELVERFALALQTASQPADDSAEAEAHMVFHRSGEQAQQSGDALPNAAGEDDKAGEVISAPVAIPAALEPVRMDALEDDWDDDAAYSSLFSMKDQIRSNDAAAHDHLNTAQHAEVVPQIATAADPSGTERALREALEKLQRMSGAA